LPAKKEMLRATMAELTGKKEAVAATRAELAGKKAMVAALPSLPPPLPKAARAQLPLFDFLL